MPPELARELVTDLRAWYEANDLSQKNLARKLFLSPQQLSEIFAGRNRPTGEQVLRIQEFLRTNMKTDYLDPRATPRPATNNPGPKTLTEARDRIADLEAQLRGSAPTKPASTVPTPTTKPAMATPAPAPIKTGDMVANRGPAEEAPVKKVLPATADTPVLIQKILDVTNLDDLRLLLNNPAHTPIQQSCLYAEIQKRRALVSNRFQ